MKKKHTIILLLMLVLLGVCSIGIYLYASSGDFKILRDSSNLQQNSHPILYRHESEEVWDFTWDDDETVYFLNKETSVNKLDIKSREATQVYSATTPYPALGFEEDQLLICEWSNQQRLSPEQLGTTLTIRNLDSTLNWELKIYDTVRPLTCSQKEILLEDNYHGAPGYFYTLDVANNSSSPVQVETPMDRYIIEGAEITIIKDAQSGETLFEIDKFNSFVKAIPSPDGKSLAMLDYEGYLWVYRE